MLPTKAGALLAMSLPTEEYLWWLDLAETYPDVQITKINKSSDKSAVSRTKVTRPVE